MFSRDALSLAGKPLDAAAVAAITSKQVLLWVAGGTQKFQAFSVGGDVGGTIDNLSVDKIKGKSVASGGSNGQFFELSGGIWTPSTAGGDLTGPLTAAVVSKIQGNTTPAGQAKVGQVYVVTSSDGAFSAHGPALTGVAASRPAAGATLAGSLYLATDTGALSVCDGSAWLAVGGASWPITVPTGLGAVAQIVGPTDQPFWVAPGAGRDVLLFDNGELGGIVVRDGGQIELDVGAGKLLQVNADSASGIAVGCPGSTFVRMNGGNIRLVGDDGTDLTKRLVNFGGSMAGNPSVDIGAAGIYPFMSVRFGRDTLAAGTKTVTDGYATANTVYVVTPIGAGLGGALRIGTVVAATSFVVASSDATDTRDFNWFAIEPLS